MTRKDYARIAATIRDIVEHAKVISEVELTNPNGITRQHGLVDGHNQAARTIANRLAATFEAENPRFDREKFIQACGL